jgi:hypothetical protein
MQNLWADELIPGIKATYFIWYYAEYKLKLTTKHHQNFKWAIRTERQVSSLDYYERRQDIQFISQCRYFDNVITNSSKTLISQHLKELTYKMNLIDWTTYQGLASWVQQPKDWKAHWPLHFRSDIGIQASKFGWSLSEEHFSRHADYSSNSMTNYPWQLLCTAAPARINQTNKPVSDWKAILVQILWIQTPRCIGFQRHSELLWTSLSNSLPPIPHSPSHTINHHSNNNSLTPRVQCEIASENTPE